ncbi:MAG: RluA family pseudouridine synthase [Verrucomicrobia bacterium]|nr:RluA family pseudouridine synthase [Verrucomicrobiota bacterium]
MSRPSASHFNFTILDETEDWIVVDKPAPLQIHPSKPTDAGLTLWDGLRAMLSYEIINGGQVSLINRLDRETSGVVLVAKNAETARRFGKAMMRRQCAKTYQAIVRGWPEWETHNLDAPILRAGDVRESRVWVKQMVHQDGAPCTTGFRVLRRFERNVDHMRMPFTLMEAKPHTGRMHQIRVHLEHLGFPVVGDKIYGGDESCYLEFIKTGWTPALEKKLLLSRQALHSQRMEVEDALGNLAWEAPLAAEMRDFVEGGSLAKQRSR